MPRPEKIPKPTVKRLSLYLRELESLTTSGRATINSRQLGTALGLTDAQVRKDLAYFGQFGHPGIGYQVEELREELRHILGTDRSWRAAVVGAGNIGRAVTCYGRLRGKGFEIVAVFDADPKIIGTEVAGHRVRPIDEIEEIVREKGVEIGMLAVPADAAQEMADRLVAAGACGILNFAPVRLNVADHIPVVSVDLSVSLEQLAFQISLSGLRPEA